MTKARRVYLIRVLLIGLVCPAVGASAQQRPPIADQIANTYGLESWGQVEAIRYTFNLDWPALKLKVSRSWVWEPKTDRISYDGPDKAGNPVTLTAWAADDAKVLEGAKKKLPGPPLLVTWCKFRGPGTVTFAKEKPDLEIAEFKATEGSRVSGKATTTATFSEPGEYVLRVVVNDWSGDGGRGFQCCWTNAMVKVSVKLPTTASK